MTTTKYGNEIDYSKIRVVPMKVYRGMSNYYLWRYKIVDAKTGQTINDMNGNGFTTIQKAMKCYTYENRDTSKDSYYAEIDKWLGSNKTLMEEVENDFKLVEENELKIRLNEKYVEYVLDHLKIEPKYPITDIMLRLRHLRNL